MDSSDTQPVPVAQNHLLIQVCAVARLLIVLLVFLFNLFSLLRLLFGKVRSRRLTSALCVHSLTTALLLCTCLMYVLLWLPHLALSLYDRRWGSSNALEQCNVQQLVCAQLSTVLLAVLTVRKIYDCFEVHNARIISLGVVFAWMLPQCIYLFTNEALIGERLPIEQQVDRLVLTLPPLFTNTLFELPTSGSDHTNRIGFVFCSQKLIPPVGKCSPSSHLSPPPLRPLLSFHNALVFHLPFNHSHLSHPFLRSGYSFIVSNDGNTIMNALF
jgi:hypothetical protein